MRKSILGVILTALSLIQAGCATGFRAGGPNGGGVSAGAAIGPAPAPVYVPQPGALPPPPAPAPLR